MTAVLEVERVSTPFMRTNALNNVGAAIESDEAHALLGHDGSAKSTLIQIRSGYHQPDAGGGVRIGG